jgi:hypothetical protein
MTKPQRVAHAIACLLGHVMAVTFTLRLIVLHITNA